MRYRVLAMLLVAVVAAFSSGCNRRDSESRLTTSSTRWSWTAELNYETEDDTWLWTTVLTQADVEIRLRDYVGIIRVRVWDGADVKIFDVEYDNSFDRDDDRHIASTLAGAAGEWRIRVDLYDFDGKLRVTFDQP